ncbi:zinc finger BED domain-containing protein 4-like [Anolis sagrei]|uniref:zinc finger BED domain-containing protein 4-like n=1 Tax=Anolis sagrei TaxID=38937 RepID=UPI0035208293
MHMKRHHPTIKVRVRETGSTCSRRKNTPTLPTAKAGRQTQSTLKVWGLPMGRMRSGEKSPTAKQITQCVGEMMALDHQPFRMVEREGFRRLMALAFPHYKIPTGAIFSQNIIPALHEGCKERLVKFLHSAQGSCIHFTSDVWSSLGGGHSYLSLTAHWWEKEGSLEPGHRWALLAMEVVGKDHNPDTICQYLEAMMREWMQHRQENMKTGFMVTDAGKNMIRAVESVGFTNVSCMAQLLHNTVKDGFKSPEGQNPNHISQLMERCRKIAGYFHQSSKAAQQLPDRQTLPQHNLLQDVSTCWSSTYEMLQRMVEQRRAVHSFSPTEWETISQLVDVLEPFKNATEALCDTRAPLSYAVPAILGLKRHLDSLGGGQTFKSMAGPLTPQAQEVVRELTFALRKHLEPLLSSKIHMLAAVCDPRIKGIVCPKDLAKWKTELVTLVREAYTLRVGGVASVATPAALPATPSASAESDNPVVPPESRKARHQRLLDTFINEAIAMMVQAGRSLSAQARKMDSAEYSVTCYFDEPQEPFSCDPLAYWCSRTDVWPDLANVACKFLSCPPASVQSERVFSLAGDVVTHHKSMLDPLAVEKLVFLKANLPVLGFPEMDFDISLP